MHCKSIPGFLCPLCDKKLSFLEKIETNEGGKVGLWV